ncbi:MAG: sugar ABC transporter substrate-binding protein, partial [Hungatella sp.]
MKLKKVMALGLAAGMVCTSLAGCGKSTSTDTTTKAAGETKAEAAATTAAPAATTAAAGEKQVLSVTTWDNDTSPQFQAVIDAYMAKNPNVELHVLDTSAA